VYHLVTADKAVGASLSCSLRGLMAGRAPIRQWASRLDNRLRCGGLSWPGANARELPATVGTAPRSAPPIGWLNLRLGQCQRAATTL